MAVPPNTPDFKKIEKELVAEQPGLAVSAAGIILAFFVGIAVRSAVVSDRVMVMVNAAAERIDPRVVARVGSAHISLSDGIFPEFAVVVRDVSIESNEACWMRPSLELDELKLPVDLWHLLRGEIFVHEIYASEVSLSLRSDMSQCKHANHDAGRETAALGRANKPDNAEQDLSAAASGAPVNSSGGEHPWDQFANAKNSVDFIRIETLRVHYLPMLFTSLELRHLQFDVRSQNPRVMHMAGIINLNGETLSGDYSSTAVLNMKIDESASPLVTAQVDGNWREGHYDLNAVFQPSDQQLQLNFDMTQIPLNQLLPLLRKYRAIRSDFNGKQTWLTLKGHMNGKISQMSTQPLQMDVLRVEGAIGEIETKDMQILRLDPLQVKPFDVSIKSLQMDNFLTFLNHPHPNPALGHLGVFHGKMHVSDANNLQLKGEHSGLEMVFSSRGARQVQMISLLEGDASLSQGHWQLKVDRIRPQDGLFLGEAVVEADQNWSKTSVRLKLDELSFSPQIQKLVTNGGEIRSISGEVFSRFEKSKLVDLRGTLNVSDVSAENLSAKHTRLSLATKQDDFVLDIRSQGIAVKEGGEPYRFLAMVMEPITPGLFEFNTGTAVVRTKHLNNLNWDDVALNADHQSVHSKGGWNDEAELFGNVDVRDKSKKHSFKIEGVRDRPVINKLK